MKELVLLPLILLLLSIGRQDVVMQEVICSIGHGVASSAEHLYPVLGKDSREFLIQANRHDIIAKAK